MTKKLLDVQKCVKYSLPEKYIDKDMNYINFTMLILVNNHFISVIDVARNK